MVAKTPAVCDLRKSSAIARFVSASGSILLEIGREHMCFASYLATDVKIDRCLHTYLTLVSAISNGIHMSSSITYRHALASTGLSSDYSDRPARDGIKRSDKLADAGIGATILCRLFDGNIDNAFRTFLYIFPPSACLYRYADKPSTTVHAMSLVRH